MKQKLTFLLTAVLLLTGLSSWGQTRDEVVASTLEPIVGSNNSYAGNCDIEIDGGITLENVKAVKSAGANVIVAGSTVFKEKDRAEIIRKLREI